MKIMSIKAQHTVQQTILFIYLFIIIILFIHFLLWLFNIYI